MKISKVIALFIILILSPLIAGIYGILHDQLTVTISEEYYTKFKFIQFRISGGIPLRLGASLVGWMATWWTGILIGIVFGLFGLGLQSGNQMLKVYRQAILLALGITFLTGLFGLLYGQLFISGNTAGLYVPDGVVDRDAFTLVGSMHNFSYLGGLFGLAAAVTIVVRCKVKNKRTNEKK